jgi:hypothetical protein
MMLNRNMEQVQQIRKADYVFRPDYWYLINDKNTMG